MNIKKIILSLLVISLIFGCSQRILDFTIISSKNIELSQFPNYERGKMRVTGEDTKVIIVLPLGVPNAKEAMDRAIESVPGAVALVDGVIMSKFWWAIVYGKQIYIVEGTPLIDPAMANSDKMDDYSVYILDRDGNVVSSEQMNKEEYYKTKDKIFDSPGEMCRELKE